MNNLIVLDVFLGANLNELPRDIPYILNGINSDVRDVGHTMMFSLLKASLDLKCKNILTCKIKQELPTII